MTHPIIEEVLREIGATSEWFYESETLRDRLNELPPESVPELLPYAEQPSDHQSLFAIALADQAHPAGEQLYLKWLDSDDIELKFNGVAALNSLTRGDLDINTLVDGGSISEVKVEAAADRLRTKWRVAPPVLPTADEWAAQRAAAPSYSDFEKRLNFVELNTDWAMLGNGQVTQPTEPLPANTGMHVVAGTAHFGVADSVYDVAIVLDSTTGQPAQIFQKRDHVWYDVTDRAQAVQPAFSVAGIDAAPKKKRRFWQR